MAYVVKILSLSLFVIIIMFNYLNVVLPCSSLDSSFRGTTPFCIFFHLLRIYISFLKLGFLSKEKRKRNIV